VNRSGSWRGYLTVYAARVVGVVLTLVLTVVSARLLQPAGRGEYASVVAGLLLGVQLLNFGLSSSLLLLFSQSPEHFRGTLRRLWLLALVWLALLAVVGAALALFALPERYPLLRWWPLWCLWIPLQLLGLYQSAALTAERNFRALVGLETGGRIAAVVLGLTALGLFGGRVVPLLTSLMVADLLIALAGARLVARAISAPAIVDDRTTAEFLRSAFRLGLRAYPLLFLPYLVIRSDILILRAIRGNAETGIYSIAAQFVDLGLMLPSTVAAFMIPELARDLRGAGFIVVQVRRVLVYALLLSGLAILVGSPLIRIVFGEAYRSSYPALVILLPGFVALSLQSVLVQYFNAQGFPFFLSGYWGMAAALNIGLNLIFVPRFGMYAAAATSSLAYSLALFLTIRRFRKETAFSWRDLLPGLGAVKPI
jgi:O-antigen/teichoic acid export membrane protein